MESSSNIQRLELDKKAVERTARHRDYPSEQVEIKPDTDMLNEAKEAAIELMLKIIQIHAKVKRARRKLLRYELELGELSIDGVDLYEQLLLDEELLSTHIQKLPSLVPIDLTWVMIQEQVTRLDALNAGDLEHIPTVYSKATDCDDEKVTLQTQFQQVSVQYGPGLSREKAIQSSISSIWESVNAAGWSQSPIADDDHAIDDYHSSLSLAKLTLQRAIEEEQIVLSAESQVPSRNQPIVDRDSSATNSPSNRLLGHISPQSLQGLSPLSQLSHLTTTSTIVTNETGAVSVSPAQDWDLLTSTDVQIRQLLELSVQEGTDENREYEERLEGFLTHTTQKYTEALVQDKLMEIPSFRRLKNREPLQILTSVKFS